MCHLFLIPKFIKKIMSYIFKSKPGISLVLSNAQTVASLSDFNQLTYNISKFQENFSKFLKDRNIDAIVAPCLPTPALHNSCDTNIVSYTVLYNLLDYPAGTIPVSRVELQDEIKMRDYPCID